MNSYQEACQCAKKPTGEGLDESEEESMARRFGPDYVRTGMGLIRREVTIGANTEKTREFVAQKSRVAGQGGSKGGDGRSGKPGENAKSDRGPTKEAQRACMCGDYGQRGNRGQHGR